MCSRSANLCLARVHGSNVCLRYHLSLSFPQNLPALHSPTTPRAPEAPTFLPPIRGGALGLQARHVLGDQGPARTGGSLPGAIVPRRLPALSPTGASVATLGTIAENKGKGRSDGRPSMKKSPHASSEEDVSGAEGNIKGSGTAPPPFASTRSPAPLGPMAINVPLPPIAGGASGGVGGVSRLPPIRRPPPNLNIQNLPTTMSPRRTSTNPFSPDAISPTRRPGVVSLSPGKSMPPRLSVVQAPPTTSEQEAADKAKE